MFMQKITIYTDGSSKGNPGPGGWASLIIHDRKIHKIFGNESNTTNNRMELLAVIKALKWVRSAFKPGTVNIHIKSDSSLIIKTMNEGWKTKKNLDLWEQLGKATDGTTIKWEWVKGHATNKYNNECDRIAQEQADKVVHTGRAVKSDKDSNFFCEKCRKGTDGVLSRKSDTSPIRVDCTHCGQYIKFAPKSEANLKRISGNNQTLF